MKTPDRNPRPGKGKRSLTGRSLIGALILLALLLVVEYTIGWKAVWAPWASVSISSLVAAFLLYFLSQVTRAARLKDFLRSQLDAPLAVMIKISSIHQSANNLLPMRLGELAFPLLARRYMGIGWWDGLFQLIWLRLMDAAVVGAVVVATLVVALDMAHTIVLFLVLAGGSIALVLVLYNRDRIRKYAPVRRLLDNAPASPRLFARLLSWTLLTWFCKLLALATVVQALSDLPADVALLATLGAEISSFAPIHGIAGSGTFEAAFVGAGALAAQGLPGLLAAAVNLHIFVLAASSLVTLLFLAVRVPPLAEMKRSHESVSNQ